MPVAIRTANAGDHDQILACVRAAFTIGGRDGGDEVGVVRKTWDLRAAPRELELVAVDDGELVGHVLAARGRLGAREAIGIAPVSVAPSRQGKGIGSALLSELLRRAEAAGWPLVVVLGDPAYYRRFNFEPSGPLGITYGPAGQSNPNFQVRRFAGYDPHMRGQFSYCWEL